ncbi:hypothetical protein Tco_0667936 [Tanacetum coccineum]
MSWLCRCAKLREAAQPNDWVEILVLYCWRSVDEDFWVAGLVVVPGWVVETQKTYEFLKEIQDKDDERQRQLEALARETEARAHDVLCRIKLWCKWFLRWPV